MRKILILPIIALFLLAACSGNRTPGETVADFFGHLRAANFAAANNLLAGGEDDPLGLLTLEDEFAVIFERLGYRDLHETNSGAVFVYVYTVDMRTVLREATAEIFPMVLEGGYSEEQLVEMLMAAVLMRVTAPEPPMAEQQIEVAVRYESGTWRIVPDAQFISAVKGGWPDFLDYYATD